MAALLLPALAVRATHNPQSDDIIKLAVGTWGMTCQGTSTLQDCTWTNFDNISWDAKVQPGTGDLTSLSTAASVFGVDSYSQSWMNSMHTVACLDSKTVAVFVRTVWALTSAGDVTPVTIPNECNLTGGLKIFLNVAGQIDHYEYWMNASVIPPATPTPSPTPTPTPQPTATPTPTPKPTVKPTPTPSATPRATASPTAGQTTTASPTATATATATSSATTTATASSPTASASPEQGVSGATGTPGEKPGREGWANTVPSPDMVSTKPGDIGGSLALAVLLILVMAFPGELFNNTFQANYDEIAGWFGWKKKS